jgi:chromosome partitioning protein
VGGRDTGSLRAALTIADVLLVPVQPRSFDVWALDQVGALVTEAREINPNLRALAFLNAADPQGRDNAEAQEALREVTAVETSDLMVVRRKAFPSAAAQGRGVVEQQPRDTKAVDEITALAAAAFL